MRALARDLELILETEPGDVETPERGGAAEGATRLDVGAPG